MAIYFNQWGKLIVLICQCVLYFIIRYEQGASLGILYPIWSKLMETSVFPLVSSLRVFAGKSSVLRPRATWSDTHTNTSNTSATSNSIYAGNSIIGSSSRNSRNYVSTTTAKNCTSNIPSQTPGDLVWYTHPQTPHVVFFLHLLVNLAPCWSDFLWIF